MKKYWFFLSMLCALTFGLTSCSDDDNDSQQEEVDDFPYTPADVTEMQSGTYCYASSDSAGYSCMIALQFKQNNVVTFYFRSVSPSDILAAPLDGRYEFNPETGYGSYVVGKWDAEFFVDKNGFLVIFDPDYDVTSLQNGFWLNKITCDIKSLQQDVESYKWEYENGFGCEDNDSSRLLDIYDIGYQDGIPAAGIKAREAFEWTIANVAKWAGSNIASGAVGALAGAGITAIMTEIGVGMGAQLNKVTKQLNDITAKLDEVLPKINQLLDGQAEAQFNNHKHQLNELSNIVAPCFLNVMEQKDSMKRQEFLNEFNAKQGTNKTNTFLDDISSLTIQNTRIYEAYDRYIYRCYPWEEQGYTARETFRSNDMLCAFMGTVLSALYYKSKNDTVSIKLHFDKFAKYLDYYNKLKVNRDLTHAVSQIAGCKIRINKKVDRRDFRNQTWLAKGVEFNESYFESSNPYRQYWVPGSMAYTLAYGNPLGYPQDVYNKIGLNENEVNVMLRFYGNKKSLQDILFNEAKCTMPFSATELNGKTLCIMRGNTSCDYSKDKTGMYASKGEICISAYTTDNKFLLRRVGVPNVGSKNGKRLWYTLWIKKKKIPVFNGWSQYNDGNLWCYPTVIR